MAMAYNLLSYKQTYNAHPFLEMYAHEPTHV